MIDVFAKNYKTDNSKKFLDNRKQNRLMQGLKSLNIITPPYILHLKSLQTTHSHKKRTHVMHLNILEAEQNRFTADLKQGYKVWVDDTVLFKKGNENRWSDEIYTVDYIQLRLSRLSHRYSATQK